MYFACQHTEEVNIVPAQKNSRSVLCLLSVKTELPAIKTYISTIIYKIRFRRRKNVLLQIKTIELNFLRSQVTLHHTEDIIFSLRNRYHCSHQNTSDLSLKTPVFEHQIIGCFRVLQRYMCEFWGYLDLVTLQC